MLQILSTSNETSTGAELVQNGNFSEIGSDLVTNGDFSAAGINLVSNPNFTDLGADLLTQPIDLTIDFDANSGGVIVDADTFTTAGGSVDGLLSKVSSWNLVSGKSYKLVIAGSTTSSGFTIGDGGGSGNEYGSDFGTHYFVSLGTRLWVRQQTAGTTDLTTFTIKELGADWTAVGTDSGSISFVEDGMRILTGAAPNAAYCNQTGVMDIGKSYKFTYTVSANSSAVGSGFYLYDNTGGIAQVAYADLPQTVGTHTVYFVAGDTSLFFNRYGNNADITLTSISVQELGEGWTLGTGWSVDSLGATSAGSNEDAYVSQGGLTVGKSYKVTFDITAYTSGSLSIRVVNDASALMVNAVGSYEVYVVPIASTAIGFRSAGGAAGFVGSFSNITVQELDPNGYWTLVGSGLTIGEDKGIYTDAGVGSYFKNTSFVVVDGKTYRASFDIPELTQGGLSWQTALGTVSISPNYGAADTGLTFDFVGDGSTGIKCIGSTLDNTSSITNLSVKLLGTYDDQSIYVTAADVQTIAQASVYYLVELTSMGSKNSLYFLPSSVVPNNGRYTKLNFTVISKDATPTPASGIISFYDSVGGFDTYPMGFYEFKIYEQTSSTNLDPLLATGLLEKGFAFVRDFSGNMQELTDGFKEYNPTLTQYVYSK